MRLLLCAMLLLPILLSSGRPATCQRGHTGPSPVAWFAFGGGDLTGSSATPGLQVTLDGGKVDAGWADSGLGLDGSGGLVVESTDRLCAGSGFTLDCWLKFADLSVPMNIISKEGEYLLRLDPPGEGGAISFFVNAGGSLEPRTRGPRARVNVWYHIAAAWDGYMATLWVNGEEFSERRADIVKLTDEPVIIGGRTPMGLPGMVGVVDEVKLYDVALTDVEFLAAKYGLDPEVQPNAVNRRRFDFEADSQQWKLLPAGDLEVSDGRVRAHVRGHGSALLAPPLRVPVGANGFVSLRMSATAGSTAKLLFATERGPSVVSFPLNADGKLHAYVFDLSDRAKWTGTLCSLGLVPSNGEADIEVDFVRIGSKRDAPPEVAIKSLLTERALVRAEQPFRVKAVLLNTGGAPRDLTAEMIPGEGLQVVGDRRQPITKLPLEEELELAWAVRSAVAAPTSLELTVAGDDMPEVTKRLEVRVARALETPRADYVPEPDPPESDYLVGAHYCPLWKQGSRGTGWEQIEPYPEREPALGWYDEGDPEVADWEIKWALDHGIQYFVYCWYRGGQGGPVTNQFLGHAIHEGLFQSRYGDRFKFAIMWENQLKGQWGIASEEDLLQNLLPYWIENYFSHPSYLKVDGKPLLFIYRPEYLVDDLGSIEAVQAALQKAREACIEAGFEGLWVLGEYRGTNPKPLQLMADEGLDYSFSYCWPVANDPEPDVAVETQEHYWNEWQRMDVIPYMLTISMGWDSAPWHGFTHSAWHLPPKDFERLCERAKEHMARLPEGNLGRRLVLLDNWNEFGEGHYIAPHRENGFGYLDAVRKVFTKGTEPHTDLVPEDVGLGPYDSLYRAFSENLELCCKRVVRKGVDRALVGWWSFDEDDDSVCALDYTGNRQGGLLENAKRVKGLVGKALECTGGSVTVPERTFRHPVDEMSIECWIMTDLAGQTDKWLVNNVHGQGAAGFRLGLNDGKLSFAIPRTRWSHHVVADEPLPLGEWVYVAATYDGETMRLYMKGAEAASLTRGGRIHVTQDRLTLGSYSRAHKAHFTGLLDEVKIYGRALSDGEVRRRAERQ